MYGATDDFGYNIVRDPVHVHDFHATLMQLLGVDHKKLTFRHEGREYQALVRLDTRSLRRRPLLERRADVELCCLSRDGQRLAAVLNREGWSEVVSASLSERAMTGMLDARIALATRSSLNAQRSSAEPPPRPMISTSIFCSTAEESENLFAFAIAREICSPAVSPCT